MKEETIAHARKEWHNADDEDKVDKIARILRSRERWHFPIIFKI